MFKIVGNEQNFPEFHQFYELGKQFVPFAQKKLGFDKPVDIELVSDPENAKDPLGKTAYYDPNKMKITLFVDKRHVKDILRSLSHELVHHTQNCRGDFNKGLDLGEGSFSTNEALRELEFEAYKRGNGEIPREFEEQQKKARKISEIELNESISNELNYLSKQDIPKENNNMSVKEEIQENIGAGLGVDPDELLPVVPPERAVADPLKYKSGDILKEPGDDPTRGYAFLDDPEMQLKVGADTEEGKLNDKYFAMKQELFRKAAEKRAEARKKFDQANKYLWLANDARVEDNRSDAEKFDRLRHAMEDKANALAAEWKKLRRQAQNVKNPYTAPAQYVDDQLSRGLTRKGVRHQVTPGTADLGRLTEPGARAKFPMPSRESLRETKENWFKGDKDTLLFERLVKKWTK